MKADVIIAAAGTGSRTGLPYNKIFYDTGGVPMIVRTLTPFLSIDAVNNIFITANENDYGELCNLVSELGAPRVKIVSGGGTRTQSVRNALELVEAPLVAIHDGARPFVTRELILACLYKAELSGSAVPVVPLTDTIKKCSGGIVEFTPARGDFKAAQTPQVFDTEKLKLAYSKCSETGFSDDASVFECFAGKVFTLEGDPANVKITNPSDLGSLALHLSDKYRPQNPESLPLRVGTGFDAHRLGEGRRLVLGGVTIPHEKGLIGHSDADVLVHAVMDALLSAAGLRDIGCYFPDTDERFKDADSIKLLKQVSSIIADNGFCVGNVSAVVMAQRPKLAPYVPDMIKNIAAAIDVDSRLVGVAATTTEKLGIIGEEKGIAAQAVAAVIRRERDV